MARHARRCRGGWELLVEQEVLGDRKDTSGSGSKRGPIVVLAGVCLRGDHAGNVSVAGFLPGAGMPRNPRTPDAPRVLLRPRARACERRVRAHMHTTAPAQGIDIRRGDVVCKVAVDDKGGGEATIIDVRGMRVEAWPEAVLTASQERNVAFRMLMLRRRDGEDRYSQVDLAQVESHARLCLSGSPHPAS